MNTIKISEIVLMDGAGLSHAIKSKQVSCVEVMTAYLDHIEIFNPAGKCLVSMQPRDALLAQAKERDAQLARGEYLGWMHGFPHAVKDNMPVKGMPFTRGSPLFKDFIAPADAIVVERMKSAGAIIIGKTNMPEFALGSQTHNAVFGTTLNPYDLSKTCGGSSGGAGVAVALRMLPVASGTDHTGSLRNPARVQQRVRAAPCLRSRARRGSGRVQLGHEHGRTDGAHGARPGDAAQRAVRLRRTRAAVHPRRPGAIRCPPDGRWSKASESPGAATCSLVSCRSRQGCSTCAAVRSKTFEQLGCTRRGGRARFSDRAVVCKLAGAARLATRRHAHRPLQGPRQAGALKCGGAIRGRDFPEAQRRRHRRRGHLPQRLVSGRAPLLRGI